MKAKLITVLVALALGAFVAAGCGSDNNNNSSSDTGASAPPASTTESTPSTDTSASSSGGGATSTLKLSADPSGALKFDKPTLSAKAGKVTVTMDNPSSVPHAVAVEGNGVDKDGQTVTSGGKSTVSVDLKPGTYEFYCPVDGHKQAGMKGELTVK
jgi:plastocyanin